MRVDAPAGGRRARRLAEVLAAVGALHVVAVGVLVGLVVPHHYALAGRVFGVGLGVTAYSLGMRHAFDADHIAAIDNTTRKLMVDGERPVSVGFWFALGHSLMVVVLAGLVAAGARVVGGLTNGASGTHRVLGIVSTGASGGFLYLIGLLNLAALVGILRASRALRSGQATGPRDLQAALDRRGLLARVALRFTGAITAPWHMLLVGLLFGIGFDTASEVTLLVLAGSGSAGGLPWYAVLVLPLLFAAGMSLFDTLDGAFMGLAYQWAFSNQIRTIYYNLTVTGLSVAVALLIGSIELLGLLHTQLGLRDPVTGWVAGISLNSIGFVVVGLFALVWAVAAGYWKLGRVEQRWLPGGTTPRGGGAA